MKAEELLSRLDGVRRTSVGWIARCPAHDDRHPSLSISHGDKCILVKCWTGCTLAEITAALRLVVSDFFYDAPVKGSVYWVRRRESIRRRREASIRRVGRLYDARREAEHFITSLHSIDISKWSPSKLNRILTRVANAYAILEGDPLWPMI